MTDPLHVLDDAAAAALARIHSEPTEHIGVLYEQAGGITYTNPSLRGTSTKTHGAFTIPRGSLRGIYHNHPQLNDRRQVRDIDPLLRKRFSLDDVGMARQLNVPSYISAGDQVYRYDPLLRKTTEVLAQIPLEPIRQKYMRPLDLLSLVAPGER